LVNTVKGLKAPEADFQDLFRTMRADQSQIFRKLRIPYCLPYFFSALKISSSLAIVGAIVGEFVGAEHGLGYLIVISSAHLETPTVFQAIGAAALVGITMFYLLEFLEKRIVFWIQLEPE
jgi:NitT/TauT family transport system permease protein